ncbi:TonB-dependent receptor plug domain-containing protein [Aquimarina sp. MMG016]|uniref:TonB-dependent receptor plug domain-containing protein n=1 Tax=Aquimarina sp. MMG016 TaxID=2822690 RepID=UPI001B3A3A94|nr:TonB-dependent receptor plug domain-containing protein [Aquimarina sp. MMG016]MBQ4822891.1 TonB-dependent receptor plug domain-containing protein [Aquimarina sp. MMG016]
MKKIIFLIVFCCFSCLSTLSSQKKVVIFWDSSWSMEQRDLDQELEYLNQYYSESSNNKTTLVIFNYTILDEIIFDIEDGNWTKLKETLKNVTYDGATSFSPLLDYSGFDNAFLFTDSFQNINRVKPTNIAEMFYIINSNKSNDQSESKLLADINTGKYIELNKNSKKDTSNSLNNKNDNVPPTNYTLNQLDKVEIKGKSKSNFKNKDAIGYAVQSIDGNQIDLSHSTLASAIQGKFSGITVENSISKFYARPRSTISGNIYGLVVLDGVPQARSNSVTGRGASVPWIHPADIADITVLKGLAATNRYGSEGVNGVILITRKSTTFNTKKTLENAALLTNNDYDGKVKIKKGVKLTSYLKELKKNNGVADAYKKYLNQRNTYKDDLQYFVDVYNFFKDTNPDLAHQVLSNILEKDKIDLSELKSLLFVLSQSNNKAMFYNVSKKLLELYPNRIESYYDLAIASIEVGEHQKALSLLSKVYNKLIEKNQDLTPFAKIVKDEIRNLVYKNKLDINKLDNSLKKNVVYDARLIFDWSYENTEFEIQFVNPQNKFFKWKHINTEENETFKNEIEQGYNKNQFEIEGNGKGKWLVNVKYIGNGSFKKKNGVFLKCRVQYDFGKANQKEETHLIKLSNKWQEEQFFTINI